MGDAKPLEVHAQPNILPVIVTEVEDGTRIGNAKLNVQSSSGAEVTHR
jgi:hypothetical protein